MIEVAKVLVQIVSGPEHATRAALGFLVAKAAVGEGHDVTLFLAADGVQWVNRSVTDAVAGLGGGKLSDDLDALKGKATWFVSKLSLAVRGVDEDKATDLGAEMGTPQKLLEQSLASDTVLTY